MTCLAVCCADEQFVLKRVADSAIDIYAMVATLSRVSRSLKDGLPSAEHEKLICEVWCNEVSDLVSGKCLIVMNMIIIVLCEMFDDNQYNCNWSL